MPSTNRTTHRLAALTEARPVASPSATLLGLLHVLESAAEEAARVGLVQTADGLGALGRFCTAEFKARHGLTH
jgi:hypothetical protein